MRVSFFVVAAATVLLAVPDAASAVSDADHAALSKLTTVNSVNNAHGNGNRFLRSTKTIEDVDDELEDDYEEDSEEEERSIHDLIRKIPYPTLDDVAGDLVNVKGALKYLISDNDELFKVIAANKWTPETMKEKLGIAAKKARMTKKQLEFDGDYRLYRHYKEFWNARKAQA
ncbi:hypothetical protein PHYBOEH_008691 [Phytophthora boehmeriae]|uniref:RxLR effector protein n=1 Tax=Phytophthora boehmeriae TaxID=109152 RepID=A0A8T1VZ19_9STRA|nr:hypothetical protein PHYBOEH_008691 [Phytophthora boehmeriae]